MHEISPGKGIVQYSSDYTGVSAEFMRRFNRITRCGINFYHTLAFAHGIIGFTLDRYCAGAEGKEGHIEGIFSEVRRLCVRCGQRATVCPSSARKLVPVAEEERLASYASPNHTCTTGTQPPTRMTAMRTGST